MSIQVETKDCTSISDAELAEMADLCAEREPRFDIGFLSKQREEWVLVTRAREGAKLRGYSFSTLERIGGTPSLLIGLATVDRTSRSDTVLRAMMGDKYRRALLAFPDEDVLVGHPPARPRRVQGLRRPDRRGPRPDPEGHRRGAGLGPPPGQALRGRRPHRRPHLRGGGRRLRGRRLRLRQPQVRARPPRSSPSSSRSTAPTGAAWSPSGGPWPRTSPPASSAAADLPADRPGPVPGGTGAAIRGGPDGRPGLTAAPGRSQ